MSNYEIMKHQMASEFLKYDQDTMIRKFSLRHDPEYLYIKFLARLYRISRHNGLVEWDDGTRMIEGDYNEAMTIYDVLCYSKPYCCLSGEFVNMRSLSSVQGSSAIADGGFFDRGISPFDGKDEALARACRRLQGTESGKGDVSCRIPMFPFFPVIFQFWDSDEEFPPTLQILMDKNTLQYMHYETIWFAVSHLLKRLEEEMGKL